MEGLFGAQLDAIVESTNEAPDIRLSADATDFARPRLAQPVLIQFQRVGGETTRVLSYSGRTVCVTLGGRRMCFEPLVTGRDEVILSGGAFCWSSEQPAAGWNGYQVTRPTAATLMKTYCLPLSLAWMLAVPFRPRAGGHARAATHRADVSGHDGDRVVFHSTRIPPGAATPLYATAASRFRSR